MAVRLSKSRDWWPAVPELLDTLQQKGSLCDATSVETATQGTQFASGAISAGQAGLRHKDALGACWWTSQRQAKGEQKSALLKQAESLTLVAAAHDDSGPPTPESEDIASSVLATASATPLLQAGMYYPTVAPSTVSPLGRGSVPLSRSGAACKAQGVHVLYTGLFIGEAEQQKLFARYASCIAVLDEWWLPECSVLEFIADCKVISSTLL